MDIKARTVVKVVTVAYWTWYFNMAIDKTFIKSVNKHRKEADDKRS